MTDLLTILQQRGSRYGSFADNARISQRLEAVCVSEPGWERLSDVQREAIKLIFMKLSRALSGDPTYPDNFHDVAGFAQLVVNDLTTRQKAP
jgi:hypothetical protein